MEEEIVNEFETDIYGNEVRIDRYDKYRHSNGGYYAYMVRPIVDLDTLIPVGVKWSILDTEYDDDGEIISSTQKNVGQFALSYTIIDDDLVIIPACGMERPTIRQQKVTKNDLDDWFYFGSNLWDEPMVFITSDERNELIDILEED